MPDSPRYDRLIEQIFRSHFKRGTRSFEFERGELEQQAKRLGVALPKNLGDLIYTFRYRRKLPAAISTTAPAGQEWIIEPAGRSKYRFALGTANRIVPRPDMAVIKVPDATPEIIAAYALTDEQALLAKVRYNRLIDVFLGVTAYSLQNHLRTTVPNMGQIEIDEIYVAINRNGQQFVIPVQAKGGHDQLSTIQTKQDCACCANKYKDLTCRPVSAQFLDDNTIAMFELIVERDEVRIKEEKHYRLVPADQIGPEDLARYSSQ